MAEVFRYERRVEFRDTDAAGMMHFSTYFTRMEEAEHAFLRSLGTSVWQWDNESLAVPSPEISIRSPVSSLPEPVIAAEPPSVTSAIALPQLSAGPEPSESPPTPVQPSASVAPVATASTAVPLSPALAASKISWPRVAARCDFRGPVRFEDLLAVEVRVARLGGSSVTYDFRFFKDERCVAEGQVTAVCCRFSPGEPPRAIPIPLLLRERLARYLAPADELSHPPH